MNAIFFSLSSYLKNQWTIPPITLARMELWCLYLSRARYTTTMFPCAPVSWREWGILVRDGYNRAFIGDLLGFRPQRKTEFSDWST